MHVLLIGGKDSSFSSIRDLDVRVTLIQERANLTVAQRDRADELIVLEDMDATKATALARAIHAIDPFDAVVSFFESCLLLASEIGDALGVVHNPTRAVRLTRDKIAMRALLAASSIPTVRYAACDNIDDCRKFLADTGGPIIVKPAGGSGSRGVTLAADEADLDLAWRNLELSGHGVGIAEEFVAGREYSVESLTRDGQHDILAVTEKHTTGAPTFIENGHNLPAQLDGETADHMRHIVERLLDAVGHRWGPAHTEIMRRPDGSCVVIESQTRFGGDQIWEMVELTTGVRLAGATVAAMVGVSDSANRPVAGGAAIRFFTPRNTRVLAVDGVEDARTYPGVVRVDMRAAAGAVLGELTSSWSRQGYVLAVGESPAQAVARVEAAFDRVEIVTAGEQDVVAV